MSFPKAQVFFSLFLAFFKAAKVDYGGTPNARSSR